MLRQLYTGCREFTSLSCEWCGKEDLVWCVWRCTCCLDYYLCNQCYHNDRHSMWHPFFRLDNPDNKRNRVRQSSRRDSRKVVLRGAFPGSHVVRGTDWKWGNQDGGAGTRGKVIAVKDWQKFSLVRGCSNDFIPCNKLSFNCQRSVAQVQWENSTKGNVYRLGHKGKVDLKCVESTAGGYCYIHHLPVMGVMYVGPLDHQQLSAGDVVKIELETEVLKLMQADHGGWNDAMATVRGLTGVVSYIHCDRDPEVRYNTNHIFKFNVDAVSKAEGEEVFFIGDVVRVVEDMTVVHEQQKDGPGWVDDLALTLGQVGVVTKLTVLGHLQVRVNGRRWVYDRRCLIRVTTDLLPQNYDEEDVNLTARSQLLVGMILPDVLVPAAAAGDTNTVRMCLQHHPDQVNRLVDGRAAIHEACKEGYTSVLEILLEYAPDLELMDCNGIRPVQACAYSNSGTAMSLLLEAGADVNSKGGGENTALMVAAALGHTSALSVLLAYPLLNIHAGGPFGNTALQCAVVARRSNTVRLLLEAGADPSITDYTATSPFHQAVATGHYQIVEKILMYFPQHINLQKEDDGYSLIHMATANGRHEVLELLLQQDSCKINAKASGDLTALLIAAHEGHAPAVELLAGYGADLNCAAEGGNTALHLILVRKTMKSLDHNSPYTLQVEKKLKASFGEKDYASYTVVACMLILEGADLYQKNMIGDSPMAVCPPDSADILRHVIEKCGRGTFHGSLVKSSVPLPKLNKKTVLATADVGSGETKKAGPAKDLQKPNNQSQTVVKAHELSSVPDVHDYENKPAEKATKARATIDPASKEASGENVCCLCDEEINVKLQPCGHAVMCFKCSHIAKRCPICTVPITSRAKIT
ncbi:E3 ubiquitin-protein ligase mib1 [Geodia barretti]|uniref:RING-type E3 ubiquitin transferase n=1 Tax=Geodia barretti TaxID=519541 RepID=A0AA35S723_GEOBA|nr:E3 ubiquitin-protein ligase mib1 [Geodia barretti]